MIIHTRETVLEVIREAGAEDWQSVVDTLEDGVALEALGFTDDHMNAIEAAHERACEMAMIHPDYKFH
jgi:hypothetical protein